MTTTKRQTIRPSFSIGDMVKWTSSSNGMTTVKAGQIEAVILAKERITLQQCQEANATGLPRDHASYLVRVQNKSGQGKGKLYWPRVNQLAICAN